jgi:hypothetical protein
MGDKSVTRLELRSSDTKLVQVCAPCRLETLSQQQPVRSVCTQSTKDAVLIPTHGKTTKTGWETFKSLDFVVGSVFWR